MFLSKVTLGHCPSTWSWEGLGRTEVSGGVGRRKEDSHDCSPTTCKILAVSHPKVSVCYSPCRVKEAEAQQGCLAQGHWGGLPDVSSCLSRPAGTLSSLGETLHPHSQSCAPRGGHTAEGGTDDGFASSPGRSDWLRDWHGTLVNPIRSNLKILLELLKNTRSLRSGA